MANVMTNNHGKELQSSVAMYVAIISWSMLFATVFLGYAIFRSTAEMWPPNGMQRVDLIIPSISSVLILLSSFSYMFYQKAFSRTQTRKAVLFYCLTLVLGLAFTYSQFQLWSFLEEIGLYAGTGIFASLIYTFTWIHTAHMGVALVLMLWLFPSTLKFNSEFSSKRLLRVKNVGIFWHFLGIIWFIIYFFVFVI